MGRRKKSPPPVAQVVQSAPQFKPVNFFDIAGTQTNFKFIRGIDGNPRLELKNTKENYLPKVKDLPAYTMHEAGLVALAGRTMRELLDSVARAESVNPLYVEQNREFLSQVKRFQDQSIERNFDIKNHTLDQQLKRKGLADSSTALGAQIALAREKVEAELAANIQHSQLAQDLKQQMIDNMYKRGEQTLNTGALELQRYNQESQNQLTAREQDLKHQSLIQDNAYRNEQLKSESENRILNAGLGYTNESNNLGLRALSHDNEFGLRRSEQELGRWKAIQDTSANPWQALLMQGAAAALGAATGGAGAAIGNIGGNMLSNKIFGEQNVKDYYGNVNPKKGSTI